MTTTVVVTDELRSWYEALSDEQAAAVDFSVALLEEEGVSLKPPHSSGIPGAPHGIRELRIQSRRFPIRIFYAFNPARQAVLIVGGDKKGAHDESKWTKRMVVKAAEVFDLYLSERGWERDQG